MTLSLQKDDQKNASTLSTLLPVPVLNDLHHRLAPKYGGSIQSLYDTLTRTFLREAPWGHGLIWRKAPDPATKAPNSGTSVLSWRDLTISLPEDLVSQIKAVAAQNEISLSTVLYTATYYFIWYKNPTPSIQKIRKNRRNGGDAGSMDVPVRPKPTPSPSHTEQCFHED